VYFSLEEKYQKNRPWQLGHAAGVAALAQIIFRRGQELIPLRGIQTACPLFPKNDSRSAALQWG